MSTIYLNHQVRELEKQAIAQGISEQELMGTAGASTFDYIRKHYPDVESLAIFCGPGNNGGDGYVVARLAKGWGMTVNVYYLVEPEQLQGVAKEAAMQAITANVAMQAYTEQTVPRGDMMIDALLGTGLQREVTGLFHHCIKSINQQETIRLAIDIPSGLNADTGNVYGIAVKADITITFIGEKLGLYTGDSPDYTGDIICRDLNIPADIFQQQPPLGSKLTWNSYRHLLPKRAKTAHKGWFGHVLVIGGGLGMAGAARMSAEAAARVGSGLVSVATRPEHVTVMSAERPEMMAHGIQDASALAALLQRATVLALGPGLGTSSWAEELYQQAITSPLLKVIDADALKQLANNPQVSEHWVLTPHPGEAASLLQVSTQEVQQDRLSAARRIQQQYGGVCVLKGAGTLIVGPDEEYAVCPFGNPGMASGGMGDVLTGIIAGLLAQGLDTMKAAKAGVLVHALAADKAALQGERGLLAADLMTHIRTLVNPDD